MLRQESPVIKASLCNLRLSQSCHEQKTGIYSRVASAVIVIPPS